MFWSAGLLVFAALLTWTFLCSTVMSNTEAPTIELAHSTLLRVAQSARVTNSSVSGNVSKHVLPSTVAFASLNTLHDTAKSIAGKVTCDFDAVSYTDLLFTYANTFEKGTNGKRKRSNAEDDVDGSLKSSKCYRHDKRTRSAGSLIARLAWPQSRNARSERRRCASKVANE
eukprot:2413921-Prymnesium_polylepis.1